MRRNQFPVAPSEDGLSLDELLARRFPAVGFHTWKKLFHRGMVKVGGARAKDGRVRLRTGLGLDVSVPGELGNSPDVCVLKPHAVLYRDGAVVAIDKPAGVKVHRNHPTETTVTLTEAAQTVAGGGEPLQLVHRLDRSTSGAVLFARGKAAGAHLGRQFARQTVDKVYLALVEGVPEPAAGVVEARLHRSKGVAFVSEDEGKDSSTAYRVVAEAPGYALVEARPLTGRTHQIRSHMAHLGHPLAGDLRYGGRLGLVPGRGQRPLDLPGAMLHCLRIGFASPDGGTRVEVEAPLPEGFSKALAAVGIAWRPPRPAPRLPVAATRASPPARRDPAGGDREPAPGPAPSRGSVGRAPSRVPRRTGKVSPPGPGSRSPRSAPRPWKRTSPRGRPPGPSRRP